MTYRLMTKDELARSKAEELSRYLMDNAKVPEAKAMSIFVLIALTSLFVQLFEFVLNKHKNAQNAIAELKNPGILQRWQLRRLIRQHLNGELEELHYPIMDGILYIAAKNEEAFTNLWRMK